MTEEAKHAEGLLESLRNLAVTLVALVQTRIEIFASEIDEQQTRLARIALLAVIAAFCLGVSLVLFVLLIVVIFWDTNRLLAIGVIAALFALGALAALLAVRSAIRQQPKILSATLAELRKDREGLDRQ
jgi:uncharacterized membrane protein YqjE